MCSIIPLSQIPLSHLSVGTDGSIYIFKEGVDRSCIIALDCTSVPNKVASECEMIVQGSTPYKLAKALTGRV